MMDDCGNISSLGRPADGPLRLHLGAKRANGCRTTGRVLRNTWVEAGGWRRSTVALVMIFQTLVGHQRAWASLNLPGGIENVLGFVPKSTFQCERDGYFGDIDNDCKLFHLCQRQVHPNGRTEWHHWTYACGNQTMFNQLTLTCAFVDEAIPCKHASQFQYLNEVIHRPAEPFLTDADVTSGISYYSNRVMSDGARARAFEDSQLLAQLGGHSQSWSWSWQPAGAPNRHQHHLQPATLPGERPHRQQSQQQAFTGATNQLESGGSFESLPAPAADDSAANTGLLQSGFGPSDSLQSSGLFSQQLALQQLNGLAPATAEQQPQPQAFAEGARLVESHSLQLEHQSAGSPTQLSPSSLSSSASGQQSVEPVSSPARVSSAAGGQQPGLAANNRQPSAQTRPIDGQQSSSSIGSAPVDSFGFSIATNHQLGLSAEQTHQFGSLQVQAKPAALGANLFQSQPVTASLLETPPPVFATAPPPPPTTTTTISTTTSSSSTSTTSPVTGVGQFATNSLQSVTLEAARPSERSPSQSQATGARVAIGQQQPTRVVVRRRLVQANNNNNNNNRQHQRTIGLRERGRELRLERTQSGFHSTRLSAQPLSANADGQQLHQNQQQQAPKTQDTALVMRREPVSASAPNSGASTLAISEPQAAWPSDDFWRRPFDAQLLNPKFESLLTRKRV